LKAQQKAVLQWGGSWIQNFAYETPYIYYFLWFDHGFVKFVKLVVGEVVMLDVHSGGLSEEGK
jgi:hypothetical protein